MNFDLKSKFFKPQPCKDEGFIRMLQEQAEYVDREILVQQFLIAYGKDTRNLDTFIGDDVKIELRYGDSNYEFLWEFCDELALAVQCGYQVGKKRKYLVLAPNGLFSSLVFGPKSNTITMEEAIDWASNINFCGI